MEKNPPNNPNNANWEQWEILFGINGTRKKLDGVFGRKYMFPTHLIELYDRSDIEK